MSERPGQVSGSPFAYHMFKVWAEKIAGRPLNREQIKSLYSNQEKCILIEFIERLIQAGVIKPNGERK